MRSFWNVRLCKLLRNDALCSVFPSTDLVLAKTGGNLHKGIECSVKLKTINSNTKNNSLDSDFWIRMFNFFGLKEMLVCVEGNDFVLYRTKSAKKFETKIKTYKKWINNKCALQTRWWYASVCYAHNSDSKKSFLVLKKQFSINFYWMERKLQALAVQRAYFTMGPFSRYATTSLARN